VETRDLNALTEFGKALWADPGESISRPVDTVATVSLLTLSPRRMAERAARGLLDSATRSGPSANSSAAHLAFYRLMPEERMVLAGLHYARWSYERLSRILSVTPERVAEIAWGARLHLATDPAGRTLIAHPVGSRGMGCPEYHPGRPWTQRFLDEEMNAREKSFLQAHVATCNSCRQALTRARNLYYAVEALVPRVPEGERESRTRQLRSVWDRSRTMRSHAELTFFQSLGIFSQRADVRVLLSAALAFLIFRIWI
jgi:hypothetical protein